MQEIVHADQGIVYGIVYSDGAGLDS